MKIRTRLLLFLLPTLASSIALVSALLAYNWYGEIQEGFKTRLKSTVTTAAALFNEHSVLPEDLYLVDFAPSEFQISGKKMTAYAPVEKGYIAADANMNLIETKFHESLFLVILSASLTIALMVITLIVIANKISRPIQKLNNSALAIAAGHYGDAAALTGPKEIVELAGTLNTMSECLLENFNRLKENSLLRERMYGEYECAMLLQHLMLQKNIDDCRSDTVAVKSITQFSDSPRGFLLDFPKPEEIHLAEAEDTGFEGMYELLTQYKHSRELQKHTALLFDRSTSTLQVKGPHIPFFWSLDHKRFLEAEGPLECGDFFFLFNEGMLAFFKGPKAIRDLLSKVLKVFAQDGLETTAAMLQKELAFASKRKELSEDLHLLCFQILNP